jgi:hypothetical protein
MLMLQALTHFDCQPRPTCAIRLEYHPSRLCARKHWWITSAMEKRQWSGSWLPSTETCFLHLPVFLGIF